MKKYVVVIDFETFWSSTYSLSKAEYNTSSYVRDKQFKIHCCAIKVGHAKTVCYEGEELAKIFRAIDWNKHHLLCQNTAFDAFILSEKFGIVLPPGSLYLDTMSMARGLHSDVSRANLDTLAILYNVGAKSKTYLTPTRGLRELPLKVMKELKEGCVLDVELTHDIAKIQLEAFPKKELELIDLTIRMFVDSPLEINLPRAKKALQEELITRSIKIQQSGVTESELMSSKKFGEALSKLNVPLPIKISKTTGNPTNAFAVSDEEFLELLDHEDERVVRLVEGRIAAKSTQTEIRAFRLIQAGETGGLPVSYNYYAAKTGRWGGSNKLNLQNLPRGSELRKSIIAPNGYVLVVTDSAQIEARINAWLGKEKSVLDAFAANKDVYCQMASDIYGRTITAKDPTERFVGKVAVLGLGYGMGHVKFQSTLKLGAMGPSVDLPLDVCKQIVQMYRAKRPGIQGNWRRAEQILLRMTAGEEGTEFNGLLFFEGSTNTIWLPNGMPMNYPGLHRSTDEKGFAFNPMGSKKSKKIYGGLLVENIVQALARIVVAEQALEIHKALPPLGNVVMMTHDEIVSCVPKKFAPAILEMQLDEMRKPPAWASDLPLNATGGYAREYSK